MAPPVLKRAVRALGWALLTWLVVGVLGGMALTSLGWLDDEDTRSSLVPTVLGLAALVGGAVFGWRHELQGTKK